MYTKKGTGENGTKVQENVFFLCPASAPLNTCLCLPFKNMSCMEVILHQSKNIPLILLTANPLTLKYTSTQHNFLGPFSNLPSHWIVSELAGKKLWLWKLKDLAMRLSFLSKQSFNRDFFLHIPSKEYLNQACKSRCLVGAWDWKYSDQNLLIRINIIW